MLWVNWGPVRLPPVYRLLKGNKTWEGNETHYDKKKNTCQKTSMHCIVAPDTDSARGDHFVFVSKLSGSSLVLLHFNS